MLHFSVDFYIFFVNLFQIFNTKAAGARSSLTSSNPSDAESGLADEMTQLEMGAQDESDIEAHSDTVLHQQAVTKIKGQHLLQLVASAKSNALEEKEHDNKETLTLAAGVLCFTNAIILTKLCCDKSTVKNKTIYDNEKQFSDHKYVICDKFLNPWAGHWTHLANFILACMHENYILPVTDLSDMI